MSTYLSRLARWAFVHRWSVLGAWVVVAALAIALAVIGGGKTSDSFTIPGTESQQVTDLLKQKVPEFAGGQMQVVLAAPSGESLADPANKQAVETTMAELAKVPGVTGVQDPYDAQLVSADGRVALGIVQFAQEATDVTDVTLDAADHAVDTARDAGLTVAYSGSAYPGWRMEISEVPEIVGLVIALVILLITFGSFVAAGLPILTAIVGVVVTIMGITAVASVTQIASTSTTVALMLGLSCGIDYGLFILSRHRQNLLGGMTPLDSIGLAAGTAGSSVVFAALTVIVALCGLAVVGIPFLAVMGFAAAAAVAVALLVALTLIPAVLGLAGNRVVRFFSFPPRSGRQERVARLAATDPESTFGARWGRFVVRGRVPIAIGGVVLLGLLAIPAASMHLGLPTGASKPTSDTQRQAYDLTSEAFGPGFNGALLVTASGITSQEQAKPIAAALQHEQGVDSVAAVALENGVAVFQVVPTTGPSDDATADLVQRIRDDRATIAGSHAVSVKVGGQTASNIDVSDKLSSALPEFLLVVVGLAFVLLTFAFRTILVPLKSVLGFLLSVVAAFGAQVAMFQWGWGEHLFGIPKSDTVSFLPIIMLAIIFGLSSDYEVFVVSRIKEEVGLGHDARVAVARGTGHAARVVTAAALIMFSIFVAFMITDDPTIKAIGFSFAAGVFLDAFVVRLTLVPAVMAIVGGRIWYHPRWFAKYVPDPDIEGQRLERSLEPALS